jgi:hypothetical protein
MQRIDHQVTAARAPGAHALPTRECSGFLNRLVYHLNFHDDKLN